MYEAKHGKTKRAYKKYVEILCYITSIFIPILVAPFVVSLHSNKLVTVPLMIVVIVLLVAMILFWLVNLIKRSDYLKEAFSHVWMKLLVPFICICCACGLFILYGPGPFSAFKTWLITTSMGTMSHQYICQWFYSDEEIAEVLSNNYVVEVDEETDTSLIGKKGSKLTPLDGDEVVAETEDYEIIHMTVNGQNAYLACVFDPSKVVVAYTSKIGEAGQYVTKMTELKGGLLGINGAGFYDPGACSSGGMPGGLTIAGGEVITDNDFHGYSGGGLIGFNEDNVLCLMKNATADSALAAGIRDAVSWGPFLVVNGKASFVKGNGGWGYAARTAIGQRADGTVLLLVVDSNATRSSGADMADLADIMVNYGAINAANLDGGTSSVMVMPSELALKVNPDAKTDNYSTAYRIINDPVDSDLNHKTRPIADAWVVLP